jgi:hypothetical protein
MRRRHFLGVLGVGFGLGTAGCSSEAGTPSAETASGEPTGQSSTIDTATRTAPPDYDCGEASRPTLDSADRRTDDAVEPQAYPGGPPRIGDEHNVVEHATQYERAFVQNSSRRDLDGRTAQFGFGVHDIWAHTALDSAAAVRLEYNYFATL